MSKGGTMKNPLRTLVTIVYVLAVSSTGLYAADFFGDALKKGLPQLPGTGGSPTGQAAGLGLDDSTIASGLKDALSVGTKHAVSLVSKLDGYFGNEAIKILLPDKIQKAAELVGKLGYQK
jgi:hypothetical protein